MGWGGEGVIQWAEEVGLGGERITKGAKEVWMGVGWGRGYKMGRGGERGVGKGLHKGQRRCGWRWGGEGVSGKGRLGMEAVKARSSRVSSVSYHLVAGRAPGTKR